MGETVKIPLGFAKGLFTTFVAFAPDILQCVSLAVATEFFFGQGGTDGVDTFYGADGVVRWVVDGVGRNGGHKVNEVVEDVFGHTFT